MGKIYVGCKEAKEISLTRYGANPGSFVLMTKSRNKPPGEDPNPSETENMPTPEEIAKAASTAAAAMVSKSLQWDDVTRSYFGALPEADQAAFMEKAVDVQKAEAAKAKADKDTAEVERAAREAGRTAKEVELERSLAATNATVDALKAQLADAAIEKRANAEFSKFPGGVEKAVEMLKTAEKLTGADKENYLAMMKSQVANISRFTKTESERSPEDIAKAMPATTRLNTEIERVAKESNISKTAAKSKVFKDVQWSRLVDEAQREASEAAVVA